MPEQCFPRGGKIKRTAEESGGDKTDEDKLFHDKPKKKRKKQEKMKLKNTEMEDDEAAGGTEDVSFVNPLKQEDLEPQMVLLGRIKEVSELQLLVSLPCHLIGAIPVTSISSTYSRLISKQQEHEPAPALSELFTAGQYVSCMVTEVDQSGNKVRNKLSVCPEDVNGRLPASAIGPGLVLQCSVKSEEDNVFDIDCGIAGTRAVLPKTALGNDPRALVPGQVLWCSVDSVRAQDGLFTVTLSANSGRLNGAEPSSQCTITRQTLLPGMRLPVTVHKVLPGGLQVRLPRGLTGLIYKTQLEEPADSPDDYNVGAAAHAHVLYTLPVVCRVYLSLRPAVGGLPVVEPQHQLLSEPAGRRRTTLVLDSDQHGVRLLLADGGPVAFSPVWHSTGRWRRGEQARCTLIGYDAMDQVYIASMKSGKDRHADLSVGARVACRVREVDEHGCTVQLDGGRVGFIPSHHLTNVPVTNLHTMFPSGKKLNCKVIQCEPERGRTVLTHNARLLNSSVSLVSHPDQLTRGSTHHWIVTKVTERGLVMTGYSGLSGFLPSAFAGAALGEYFPGQILQCTVYKVRPASEVGGTERRVTLCPAGGQPWRGRLARARVTGRAAGRLLVVTEDGRPAELPAQHLTDVPEHADAAMTKYNAGDELEIVGLAAAGNKLTASAKPLLLEYVKNKRYPTCPEEIVAGLRLPGSVVGSDEQGVVVAFPSEHLSGTYRVPLKGLCDGWQKEMPALSSLQHRTLLLQVLTPPPESADTDFLRLSARVDPNTDQGGGPYLLQCLQELCSLVPARPAVGEQVTAPVVSSGPTGLSLQLPDGRLGVLPDAECLPAGHTVTATVLQIAPSGQLSLTTGQQIQPAHRQVGVTVGSRYRARVLTAPAEAYQLTALLLPPAPPCLVQVATRRGLNDLTSGRPRAPPGDILPITVTSCERGLIVGVTSDQTEAGRYKSKPAKKPAKKVRPRDKHWKKRSRSGPGGRPILQGVHNTTAIRYSRFSLQDDN